MKTKKVDLDVDVIDDIIEEFHVQNEEEEERDNNRSFEEDENNTNDKHIANEGGDLRSVSIQFESILIEANQSATKIIRNLTTSSRFPTNRH